MKKTFGFISHRCNDYHKEWNKDVFELFMNDNDISPVYGCILEPNIKGIISKNIRKGMSKSHIYFAFITNSWSYGFNPVWPKKEWEFWQELKKDTFSHDCCFGFYLQSNSHSPKRKTSITLPPYISELMSYSISEEKDKHHDTILAKVGKSELYINEIDKNNIVSLIKVYKNSLKLI
jgi:hypothetical protein